MKSRKGKYTLSRSMLLELFFRYSTFLFTNQQVFKGGLRRLNANDKEPSKRFDTSSQKKPANLESLLKSRGKLKAEKEEENEYQELSLSQAFYLFVETKLKPLHKSMQIRWQDFRDEELWVENVQRVFTLNEAGIKALYDKYVQRGYTWLTI